MPWKGIHPLVKLTRTVYQKGISLTKQAMREGEARAERNPSCPRGTSWFGLHEW